MRVIGCLIGVLACGAITPSVAQSQANKPVTIRVNYSNVVDRAKPDPKQGIVTNHSLTVTLSGFNNVQEQWDSRSGRSSRQSSSARILGGSETERGGTWKVAGPEQLVRRIDYPQNWTVITIRVTGQTSCEAKIDYVLKPGFKIFTFRRLLSREIAYYSRAQALQSTCQIQ
jgi:hypothetical protein